MPPEPVLRRHADHDPSLICRPALGCADTPYRCDDFDPADWPEGKVPDFSLFREWEKRQGSA